MPELMTPSNCKLKTCSYNQLPPGENSQECIACEGNKVKGWRPTRQKQKGGGHGEARNGS